MEIIEFSAVALLVVPALIICAIAVYRYGRKQESKRARGQFARDAARFRKATKPGQ